jgi:hypothetical protein
MSWSFRRSWRAVAAVGLCLLILLAGVVGWRASRALRAATQEVGSEGQIWFTARPLPQPQDQDFESISTPAVFFLAAQFLGDLYIAGPAGLSQYNASGTLLKQYAVGRELPSSPLVAMAPAMLADSQAPELVIATAQDGLLVFDGRAFRQIIPQDAGARTVTAVLPVASGHLLIGTRKRGVLLYDGKKITVLHPALSNLYVTSGSALSIRACSTGMPARPTPLERSRDCATARYSRSQFQGIRHSLVPCSAWLCSRVVVSHALWLTGFLRLRFSPEPGSSLSALKIRV